MAKITTRIEGLNIPTEDTRNKALQDLLNYQPQTFNFAESNPYLNAMKSASMQGTQGTANALARNLAQRGVTQTGAMDRTIAGLGQQASGQMQNLIGQDYARQRADWRQTSQDQYNQLANRYNTANQDYQQGQDQYYQRLALAQQNSMQRWQEEQQKKQGAFNNFTTLLGLVNPLAGGISSIMGAFANKGQQPNGGTFSTSNPYVY